MWVFFFFLPTDVMNYCHLQISSKKKNPTNIQDTDGNQKNENLHFFLVLRQLETR